MREGKIAPPSRFGKKLSIQMLCGILYGNFLAAVLSFLIISFVIFLLIKVINTMKKKEEPAPAAPAGPTQEELLAEIRDLLKNKS